MRVWRLGALLYKVVLMCSVASRARAHGLAFALILWAPCMPAQVEVPAGADSAINRPYQDPDFAEWRARFERAGREVYDQRERIRAESGLEPGMAVADIGAGTGLFTLLFAPRVGHAGRVYAVDVSQVFIDNVLRRARERRLANVRGIVNTHADTGLEAGSIDLAFVCDTYHHFERPAAMLASIHAALRPGGRLIVIDFEREPGVSSAWVMQHVRADKRTVIREVEAAGFTLLREARFMRDNYFLEFARLDPPA
jgi:predicted methyltransferase